MSNGGPQSVRAKVGEYMWAMFLSFCSEQRIITIDTPEQEILEMKTEFMRGWTDGED